MKKIKISTTAIGVLAVLAGCGVNGNRFLSVQEDSGTGANVLVQRAQYNQVAIEVRQAPDGAADLAVIESQGYEEAKDRFEQMDMLRRLGRGTLSEVFGASALPRDLAVAAVGLREGLQKKLDAAMADPETFRLLEAFSAGVNRFIDEMDSSQPALAKTYRQLTHNQHYRPTHWEPADSLAVAQSIAFYLSSSLQEKLTVGLMAFAAVASASHSLSATQLLELPSLVASLLDLRPLENTFILDANSPTAQTQGRRMGLSGELSLSTGLAANGSRCQEWGFPFPECRRQPGFGSNNFVLSPGYAGGSAAFLANDPHLPLSFPMTFYELALDSKAAGGSLRVRGVNLPGLPGVLIGHNDDIAWGMTNLTADVDDIYLDRVDANETTTVFRKKNVPLQVFAEKFLLRNADGGLDEKSFPVRVDPNHGPIFSDYFDQLSDPLRKLGQAMGSKVVATYKWTGQQGTQEFAAVIGLNRARDFASFKTALNHFGAGAQNVVYADRQGNIGYYAHGNFPVRKYSGTGVGQWLPFLPTPSTGSFEWESKYRAEIPELYNPRAGRIVTANNDPYGETAKRDISDYKDYFGFNFADGARAARITQHLDELRAIHPHLDADVLGQVQYDHIDKMALRYLQLLAKAQPKLKVSTAAAELMSSLLRWDGDMSRQKTEPVLFDAWFSHLTEDFVAQIVTARMPAGAGGILHSSLFIKTIYHKLDDDLASEDSSSSVAVLQRSLEDAAKQITSQQLQNKRWGELHRLTFGNQLEGLLAPFPMPSLERDGYWETVDVSGPGFGPNFRLILTLEPGMPIAGAIAVPGGNFSAGDTNAEAGINEELLRWRDGRYRELVPFAK